ncbi:MAG TPA: CDP-glycerol glycerophosphotransferase family protein [Nocardioidaceae bacterium]|nr:CDP-glycerol glycerophosphotransferase family protein [Nocardioidaceae bacterium]
MTRVRSRVGSGRVTRVAARIRQHPAARRLLPPTVSVIVPVYNVEKYLAECLDSIAAQSFDDYEVVVVDDGSPDGSRAIAERYAAADSRVRVVRRENGGLGAARNTGIRHARGEFLTFLDSDDVLPPHALRALVTSARETGSDVVVGSLRRFDAHGAWAPQWVPDVHVMPRHRIRLQDFLPLIRNLYTVDKLYRRRYWMDQGLWFREGVAYEDQPLVTQLLAGAESIDVIPDDVYHYRRRDDRSSISQETASLTDLRQRVEAWRLSREALRQEGSAEIYHGWLRTLFGAHFHWYLSSAGTVDDDYWTELQKAVVEFTADAPQSLWDETSPEKRVLIELARQDRREDVQEFVRQGGLRLDQWKSVVREDGVLVHLPFFADPELDPELFLLRPEQVRVAHSVESVRWEGGRDGTTGLCTMSGWAYLRKVDLTEHGSEVSLVLRGVESGVEHVFPSHGTPEPAFPPPVEDSWCDYAPGSFQATLDVGQVVAGGDGDPEDWEVLVRVRAAGFTVTEPVSQLVRSGSAGVIPAATLPDGDRVVAAWQRGERLRFRRAPLAVQVTNVRLEGRQLSASLAGPAAPHLQAVEVAVGDIRRRVRLRRDSDAPDEFRITLPRVRPVPGDEPAEWAVLGVDADGSAVALTMVDEARPGVRTADGALTVTRRRNGALGVTEWTLGAVADEMSVSGEGVLRLAGSLYGPSVTSVSLVTRNKKARAVGSEVAVEDGRFDGELPLEHEVYRFGRHPLPSGEHDVALLVRLGDDVREIPLRLSPDLGDELPVLIDSARHQGRLVRGPAGGVRVSLVRPVGDARGRYRQEQLRNAPRSAGLTRGLLVRAYFGEHATDNGVAVQEELRRRGSDLPVFWAVQDYSVPVPEGGVPVVVNSREWYELLSSVTYYMDNMFQPDYHRKPDGQVIVQTFHGYPFKVMGHTHWRNLQLSRARIDAYDGRAAHWDYLVSPARYATPLLRREFNYHGDVLEIGYPRNDVLQSPEAGRIRGLTRSSLGLEDGQTAVLYAPTFRDYLTKGESKAVMADFFDFAQATKALGDEFVILVRGHAFNARSRHRVGSERGVLDVTDYPEVSDLYLAADVGVVDYSSLRFDFGVTGKPMIFLCPDLQRYKDTRGWLFDFEPTAPGPLVSSTAEVVALLQDLEGVRRSHREEYDAFRSRYLGLEDGRAAERLVDAVFAPRGDA